MDPNVSEWLNLVFRWIHVLAGVMWIGHLWFFNFVNAQLAKTYTPESKKAVLPELMPRALYSAVGGLLGSIMAASVWMRIWPNQKKIIAGVKGTAAAPGPEVAALAGLRSKHNTYLSMPLMFLMVSNHFPTVYGNQWAWI